MERYRPRAIAGRIREALDDLPVVVVTGLRQTGKSTLLLRDPTLAKRRYVSLDDFAQLEAARRNPEAFARQPGPLTVDEAQRCPELLLAIKAAVDADRRRAASCSRARPTSRCCGESPRAWPVARST